MKFADTGKEFDRVQKEAVANKGLVMPNLNSASVEVVSVPMHDFSGTGKQAIDKAKQWASNNIVGQHTAKSGTVDEFTYSIDEKAIDKFLSQSATQSSENLGVHLAVLKSLPTVIDKSIDTEVHADYIKDKGVRWSENGIHSTDTLIHRFYGAVLIDGNIYRTKTTIKEKRNSDNKPYTYEVTKVDLVISGSTTSDALTKPTLEVAKLLQGVEKSYDKGKYLLDESPLTSKGVMESTLLFRIVGEIGTSRMEGAEKVLADLRVAREMENGQSIENAADYYFSQIPENLKVEARKYNRAQDEEAIAKIQANREAKRAWADYIRAHEHLKEWQSLNEQEQKKRIRLATGWERGADGKWRYEIPDERFTPEFIASLEKSSERYKDERTQERYTYIGEIYGENSELLKIYPNLSEVSIRINIHPDNKDEGYFMKGTEGDKYTFGTSDEIAVKATSIENAQSILTHEIQHAIQHIEGFARGGNVNEFKKKYAELNERVDDYNKKLSKASSKGEKELYAQLMSEKMDVVKEIQSLQDEYGVVGVKPYNNLAGEVEARNTETRKDFTPEQRREKLLQETEDVARAEQIVLRNTGYQSKGEYKESYNYVVFDENALEIEEHIQFLSRPVHVGKDADGATVVYGWTENGKVYLVKERLNPETPIHEYSHIWDIALQENNPELWKHGVELLKQTKLWDEVKNDPNYSHLKDDNQVASEVKARLTGKKGAEVFARMQQEAKETGDTGLIAKADKLIHDIKQWLSDTWHWLKETMTDWSREEIERVTLDDFVNMTIADMVKGTPLSPKGEESRNALRLYDAVPSEELAEIKERAISDGTFMKAPNGRPTNLTEKQWLQVRTPAFKEWFGDWELANKLRMINNLAPLTVKGKEISNDEAEIIYKSLLNGKNKLDNREVRFVNSTFGKIIRHKGFDVRQIISQLKEIFDNSVPILSETVQVKEGHKQHSNLKDYHHYLGKISFDGQEYYVRFTVQELTPSWKRRERIGQSQLHNTAISDINIYKKSDPSVTTEDYSIGNDNRDRFVDTKLQEFFEKAREAQENTSKVVDENGEPLVQALSEYMHDIEKLNTSNSTGQSDDIRFRKTSTIGFYSTVEDALEKITQEKGTPEQFKAMLLKNGAKQAEMDWMGWDEEFANQKSVTKADIQQWIDKNRIEVEEVTKSDEKILVSELGKLKLTDDQIQTLEYKMIAYYPEYDYIKSLINGANVYIDRSGVALLDESYIEDIEEYEDNYDKVANLLSKINDRLKKEVIGTEKTEYPQATTFKGKNYKELLLTMPAIPIFEKWEPVEIKNSGKYFLKNNRKKYKREGNIIEYPNLAEAELKAKKLNRRRAFHYNAYYKSSHWDEPNILAHIRFSEIEQNGEKILAIEEIQSDWAQEGKKKGFDVEIKTNAQTNLDNYRLTLDQKYNSNWDSEIITEEEYNELSRLEDLTEESIDYDQERNTTIDDMPFKKTDQWVNLSLRRMMRYAAEHGFDRIAWTTGEMQVDRYDFSKRVDRIEYKVKPGVLPNSKSYSLNVFDKQGDLVKSEQDLNEEYIEEIIGKELANKIANGEGYSKGDKKVLSGLDLKVGGEGMKAFYDKIIPSAASKLGKPFGAKVELIEIDGADESILNFPTNEILTVQSLPVTESMKETAMNGVPLFSLNRNKNFTRVDDIETVRKAIQNLQDKAVNAKPLFMYSSEEELGRHLDKAGIPRGAARKALADGNTIGFYDEGRGVVFIDLRKVGSVKEGVATWLHEMGIHAGLRNIIPAEQFDSFMEDIYDLFENNAKTYNENTKDQSSKAAKKVWDAVMGSSAYDKVSKSQKGEEMLAYFGERYSQSAARGDMNLDDRSIFRQIVEKITNLLRKVFGLTPKQLTLEDAELIVKGSIRSMFATGTRPIDSINQVQQEGKLRPDGKIEYKFTPLERAINKAVGIKAYGMIEVDGIMRPTTNSEGRPIATTPEGLRNFWRWFSDSEKAKRIEKLKNSSPVELSYSNEKSLPEFRKETYEKGKYLRGSYVNKDTGRVIKINRKSLDEIRNHSYTEYDAASILFIPEFIERSILIEPNSVNDNPTKSYIKSYDYFVLGAKINGEDYTVRISIANTKDGEAYYDHGLTKIEKGKLIDFTRLSNALDIQELPLSDIKDKRLLSILQVNTSKIVDEQGKPMVLYHGTGSDFNDFRYTQDIGFHFGTAFQSSNIAELYEEGSVMPVYLKINNPLKTKDAFAWYHIRPTMNVLIDSGVITQDEADAILNDKLKSENEKLKDVKKILSEKGYDGILYENVTGEGEGISYIVFSPDQIKSATGNNGNFDQNDFNILRRTITTPLENVVQNAADRYAEDRAIKRTWDETRDQMIQFWKDIDLPIKRLQEEIVRLGGKLSDNSNPYRAIDLAKGRLESLYTRYLNNKFNPVLKAIADIRKTGISGADILPYMISKHAIERNPDLRQNEINELVEKFKKSYPNATQDEIDIFRIDLENELRDKDYSGIMPFDKDKEGNSINGFKNPEELARAIVTEFEARFDTPEKKQLLKKLWDANYEAGQETLKIWFDGNSMSKEEYDYQRERYKYFVPLRGWREGPANQLIYHKGEGFSKSLIHAKGRTSLAENPLAYMKSVAFKALTEQVDNEVRREMLNLIIDNVSIPVWCDWQFVQHTLHVPDV